MSLLRCTRCRLEKPRDEFRSVKPNRGTKDRFSWCRPCCSKAQQGYIAMKDKAVVREAKRATHYRTVYGVTLGEYEKLNDFRDKGCWVCNKPGKTRGLSLDHDHKTGQVRGLLCQSCNRGLRWFSDDPTRLRNAATYLETCDQLMVAALAYSDSPTGGQ